MCEAPFYSDVNAMTSRNSEDILVYPVHSAKKQDFHYSIAPNETFTSSLDIYSELIMRSNPEVNRLSARKCSITELQLQNKEKISPVSRKNSISSLIASTASFTKRVMKQRKKSKVEREEHCISEESSWSLPPSPTTPRKNYLNNDTSRSAPSAQTASIDLVMLGDKGVGKSALTVRYLTGRYIGEYSSEDDILYNLHTYVKNVKTEVRILDTCNQNETLPTFRRYSTWANGIFVVYDVGERKSFDFARRVLKMLFAENDCNNNNEFTAESAEHHCDSTQIKKGNSQINHQVLREALVELEKFQNGCLQGNDHQGTIPRTDSPMIKTPNVILIGNKRDMQQRRKITEIEGRQLAHAHGTGFAELSAAEELEQVRTTYNSFLSNVMRLEPPSLSLKCRSLPSSPTFSSRNHHYDNLKCKQGIQFRTVLHKMAPGVFAKRDHPKYRENHRYNTGIYV